MNNTRYLVFCIAFLLGIMMVFPLAYFSVKYTVENVDDRLLIVLSAFVTFSIGMAVTIALFHFSDKLVSWIVSNKENKLK